MDTVSVIFDLAFLLALFMFVYAKIKSRNNSKKPSSTVTHIPSITGQQVTESLRSLGYFRFTDPDKLDVLIREVEFTYDEYQVLNTMYPDKPPFEPFCRRFYFCDGETLFEEGGLVDYLKEIKPTFDKLNIPLEWGADYVSEDGFLHTIIINEKKYVAYEGDPSDPRAWGIATKKFIEMLNDQLTVYESDERVYPILYNNDGRIIFLTEAQYHFISEHFDNTERPMEVNLWWQTFNK